VAWKRVNSSLRWSPHDFPKQIYLSKGQIVFFELESSVKETPHSHKEQWGTVLDGEMTLFIDGKAFRCGPGDSIFIPAGAIHYGVVYTPKVRTVEYFADVNRYKAKKPG
jgi:quercetin dioxygenase-like cupin family protein